MAKHYLIFIHGIGERKPNDNPSKSYEDLWQRILSTSKLNSAEFEQTFAKIYTDWHIDPLQSAATKIHQTAFPQLKNQQFNLMRGIRGFATSFVGDIIAYVSEDVNFIRRTVWQQIWAKLEQPLKAGATYSIVAHSLGTVVGFDYLFYLFPPAGRTPSLFVPELDPENRPEDLHLQELTITHEDLSLLQTRFRHFFSMGSPLGLFMLRKGSLWAEGNNQFEQIHNPVYGENRFWYNFWDSEDAIAYPLAKLFQLNPQNQGKPLSDVAVETGFLVLDSHTQYWSNQTVAEKIAAALTLAT